MNAMIACATALLVVTAAFAQSGDEPIMREDFEAGREAWEPTGTGALDTSVSHAGEASMRIADEDAGRYFTVSRAVEVEPEARYELRFWCFTEDADNASVAIVQQVAGGEPATADGRRLTEWVFPYQRGRPLGQWVEVTHLLVTGPETARLSLILNPADGSPANTGTAWYDDIELRPAGKPVPRAEESMPLHAPPPLEIDFGAEGCTIICPEDALLRDAAARLAAAIERATGRLPRIVADDTDPATLGSGPLLVMGNLVVSQVGRRLYFEGYDFTDYAWPGRGGYVLRTIRDPFATGAHVLMIGGSYPEDIAAAADRAGEIATDAGPVIGYLNEVRLGENADVIAGWSSEFLADDVEWKRAGSLGSWEHLWQIGRTGMGYLRTGDEAYLEPFRRELLSFFDHDVINRTQESPPQIHSLIDAVLLPWDLMADHPFFTPEQRASIDEKFLILACSQEGPRSQAGAGWGLRGNHGLGKALDGYWLARYFLRRYDIPEAREWLDIVDRYFAPQLLSSKPTEDGGYHQYEGSLLCTLMYALAAGKPDYLQSRALREATDRAILDYRVGRGPMAWLGARAVSAGDPQYLALMADGGSAEYVRHCAAMGDANLLGENLRSFCGFEQPAEKPDLLGVSLAPLDPMWHEMMRAQSSGEALVTTAPEESYDKLVIRDSYRPDGFYLRMDGLGHGGHSFQDANCITAFHERGEPWLAEQFGYRGPTCSTLRQQNGVFVALDGQGPPGVHVFARLLYVRSLGDGLDAMGGALEGIGEVSWQRHLLRSRDAWTLVVDRAASARAGEMLVERHWHIRHWDDEAQYASGDDSVVCRAGGLAFHLQSAGLPPGAMTGTADRMERVRADVDAGGFVDIASLIFVDDAPDAARYRLSQTAGGWRVTDTADGSAVDVAVGDDGLALAGTADADEPALPPTLPLAPTPPDIALPWLRVPVGGEVTAVATNADGFAAATRDGEVAVFGLDGTRRWAAQVGGWVLSLHFVGAELLVGQDDGTLSRFHATGRRLWSVTIPYAHIGWPHWSDGRSRIREITSADIDGDGASEILVSNGDRRLYAFTGEGEQVWKQGVQWGVPIALTPATYLGQFALLSGVTGPTLGGRVRIHGAAGDTLGDLAAPYMHSQQIRDLRLADVTGDGVREIIVASDTNSHQLAVCNEDRSLLWKADVGGGPDALAVRSRDGVSQILVGSRCGYVHAFAGATGEHQWCCYLGNEPRMLAPRGDGSILAICLDGSVFVLGDDGRLLGRDVLPAPVTALLRPGEHRVAPSCVPVGTGDGAVNVLPADGA